MTKAFVNVKASIAITKQLLKLPGIDRPDDIMRMLKYVDDPIKMSVCNLVRFFGKDMDTIDSMYSSFTHASKRHARFMELAKTPGTVPLMGFVKGKANDVIMFPNIPIKTVDERYTSKMASRAMIEMGMKKKDRQVKGNTDQIAATIMLQEYLQSIS